MANRVNILNHRWTRTILCGIARCEKGRKGAKLRYADWLHRRPTRSESACLSRTLSRLEINGYVDRLSSKRVRLSQTGRDAVRPDLGENWMSVA